MCLNGILRGLNLGIVKPVRQTSRKDSWSQRKIILQFVSEVLIMCEMHLDEKSCSS